MENSIVVVKKLINTNKHRYVRHFTLGRLSCRIMIMSAARQRCYMARVNADPHKRAEYLMRRRQWRKKEEAGRYVTMGDGV